MSTVFTGGDLTGIFPGAQLNSVVHASYIQVDESGTTAAAGTGGFGITTVAAPVFNMVMNRPFFFAVRDGATGALLFAGVVLDPTSS